MTTHPDYPPANGDPQGDRCICGGIRHWHAIAPYGCDDCDCRSFLTPDDAAIIQSNADNDAYYRAHDRTIEATS